MTVVHMGNNAPMEGYEAIAPEDGQKHVYFRPTEGERITEIHLASDLSFVTKLRTVEGLLPKHLQEGANPVWFESDDPQLAEALNTQFGIKGKRNADFGAETDAISRLAVPLGPLGALMATTLLIPAVFGLWSASKMSLRTQAGRDFQAGVMFSTASTGTGSYAPAYFIGLSANNTAPVDTDTTLAGEIVSGTLIRAAGTYAHTTGTSAATLTRLFTSDQTINIAKIAVFNNVTFGSGTMVLETLLLTVASCASGDQCNVSEGITL